MDLISRQAAIDALCEDYCFGHHDCKRYPKCENLRAIQKVPPAQPTDADIQKMQDIEHAMLEKAYECGKQDAAQWIPCSERLPEENTPVLLGVRFKDDFKYFVTARVDYNYWTGLGRDIRGELAWMPLPKPYQEGEQNE